MRSPFVRSVTVSSVCWLVGVVVWWECVWVWVVVWGWQWGRGRLECVWAGGGAGWCSMMLAARVGGHLKTQLVRGADTDALRTGLSGGGGG